MDVVGREESVFYKLEYSLHGMGDNVGVVAAAVVGEAEEVASGLDGQAEGLFEPVVPGDGSHGEVVGDDDTVETELGTQDFFYDGGGEGGREVVAKVAVDDVCHHHHVDDVFVDECAVGQEFFFLPGFGHVDKAGMGVAGGTAVAGEVFEAADDVFFVQLVEPEGGEVSDGDGVGREAALQFANDGAGGVDIDIDAGGEVEVDAGGTEFVGNDGGIAGDTVVAALSGGLCALGGGEAVAGAHAGYVAAFLVDADEEVATGVFL